MVHTETATITFSNEQTFNIDYLQWLNLTENN